MATKTGTTRRFVQVFLSQSEARAWPRFPDRAWSSALAFADAQADYVRPRFRSALSSESFP